MRLSCVLMAVAVSLLASYDVASAETASGPTQLSRMTTAEDGISSVGVMENDLPTKRRLRVARDSDDDEARMFESLKHLLPMSKIVSKDGKTLSGHFVKNLLSSKSARDKVFNHWYQSQIDGNALKKMLGDMNKKGRTELLNRYTSFLSTPDGLLHHNAGPIV